MGDEMILMPMPQQSQGVPQPINLVKAELIEKLDPKNTIDYIKHALMGEELINGEWRLNPALKNKALTEYGAVNIANFISGIAHIGTSFSKYDKEMIKTRLTMITDDLMENILYNFKEYGIRDATQISYIDNIVIGVAMPILFQADGASIQDMFSKVKSESTNISQEKKEPGRISRMSNAIFGKGQQ